MKRQRPGIPTQHVLAAYRQVLSDWPVPHESHHLATRAGSTFVVSCGPEHGPALVLLHGTLSNAASWMFDAERWSEYYRVHAVDIIGEPGLSKGTQPALDSDAHAQWLDDVLDALGVESAAFVGLSFGGFLALDYALRRPARVNALVLVSPSGIGRQRAFLLKALPLLLLGRWGRERLRRAVMGPAPLHAPARAQPLLDLLALIRAEVRPRPLRIPRISDERLATLHPPAALVMGARDALIDTPAAAERMKRLVPTADVTLLADAYHYIPGLREDILARLCQMQNLQHE